MSIDYFFLRLRILATIYIFFNQIRKDVIVISATTLCINYTVYYGICQLFFIFAGCVFTPKGQTAPITS